MLFLGEIGTRVGMMTISWDSPVNYSKWIEFLPKGENQSQGTIMPLIFFLFMLSKGFNFSSSGREDVDVRTLGNGKIVMASLD